MNESPDYNACKWMVDIRYQSSKDIPHQFQLLNDKTNNLDVSDEAMQQTIWE
jgi:hypothetical protein